jgi:hypothetical protein
LSYISTLLKIASDVAHSIVPPCHHPPTPSGQCGSDCSCFFLSP